MSKESSKEWSPTAKQRAYIEKHIEYFGNKTKASKAAKCDRKTVYNWLGCPHFSALLKEREDEWADQLMAKGIERALESRDTLLIFFLKALRPEMFDENIRRAKWLAENNVGDPDSQHLEISFSDASAPFLPALDAAGDSGLPQ